MDGKGGMGMRNWEFSDHIGRADSMLKPGSGVSVPESDASAHQAVFLKMSAYADRNSVISESNSEATSMDFSWVPQLSSTKNSTHLQVTHISSEMIDMPNMPSAAENTLQNGDHEAKPTKVRKQQPCTKGTSRVATKVLRPKEAKKQPSVPAKKKGSCVSTGNRVKKNQDIVVVGGTIDFSGVPVPVCSCTSVPRQCYRWGAGGWQSSCCTTSISEYPLPMSSSRPGARLAGRKMSIGAYGKLLQRLAAEGQDLSYAVDLKDHWARHGTNKFVTIR